LGWPNKLTLNADKVLKKEGPVVLALEFGFANRKTQLKLCSLHHWQIRSPFVILQYPKSGLEQLKILAKSSRLPYPPSSQQND